MSKTAEKKPRTEPERVDNQLAYLEERLEYLARTGRYDCTSEKLFDVVVTMVDQFKKDFRKYSKESKKKTERKVKSYGWQKVPAKKKAKA